MRRGRGIHTAIILLIAVYLGCNLLTDSKKFRSTAARFISGQVEEMFGSDFSLGEVSFVRPAGISISNVVLLTPQGDTIVTMSSATVRMKALSLLSGRIDISGIRLLNPDIRIWRDSVGGAPNYQFIVDSLADGNRKKNRFFSSVNANSVIIRNGRVSYDIRNAEQTAGRFNKSHIRLTALNTNISLKALSNDTASMFIRDLHFAERSGFELKNLSARLNVGRNSTSVSNFRLRTGGTDIGFSSIAASVGMDGHLDRDGRLALHSREIRLVPSDFSAFVPMLDNFHDEMTMTLSADGSADSLVIGNIKLKNSVNDISAGFAGTVINPTDSIVLKGVQATLALSADFGGWLTANLPEAAAAVPVSLNGLGRTTVIFKGNGNIDDNTASLDFNSDLAGQITAMLKTEKGLHTISADADNINLGEFTGNAGFGRASLGIDGSGRYDGPGSYSSDFIVKITYIEYKNYKYDDIDLKLALSDRIYNMSFDVADSNADISGEISHRLSDRRTTARVSVDSINLATTGFAGKDSISVVSARLTADVTGKDIDRMRGTVTFDTISVLNSRALTVIDRAELNIRDVPESGNLLTSFESDVLNFTIDGKYRFSTMAASLAGIIKPTFPSLYERLTSRNRKLGTRHNDSFELTASVSENALADSLLGIPARVGGTISLYTRIDDESGNDVIKINIPEFQYDEHLITDYALAMENRDSLMLKMEGWYESDKLYRTHLSTGISGNGDRAGGRITWRRDEPGDFDGELLTAVTFGPYNRNNGRMRLKLDIDRAEITVDNRDWHIDRSQIVSDSGRYDIHNLKLYHGSQRLMADGSISADTARNFAFSLDGFEMARVMELLHREDMEISGMVSGSIQARALLDKPIVSGYVHAGDLSLMGTEMNRLDLTANWNDLTGMVELNADIINADTCQSYITGVFSPQKDSLDINLKAERLSLYFLNSFLPKKVFRELRTYATTDLRIFGRMKELDLEGTALLEESFIDVAASNTRYFLPRGNIVLTPGLMQFDRLTAYDQMGNDGYIDLVIRHKNLHDYSVDLDVQTDGLQAYDLPQDDKSSKISGRVFIAGNPKIRTSPTRASITGNCSTAPGSWLKLDLTKNNATTYSFLTIQDPTAPPTAEVVVKAEDTGSRKKKKKKETPFDMVLNVSVNNNAKVAAALNNVNCTALGHGDIQLRFNKQNGFTGTGIFDIDFGNCILSLQQLLRKEFSLLEDSRIIFNGEMSRTSMDIHACHMVNSVSMYDLDASAKSSSSRVRARCLLDVSGTASNPVLSFNVDLPQGSAEERQMVANVMTTDEERNMQFIYLLTIGKFYTYDYSNATRDNSNTAAMQSLINSTINGQINNILSQVINSEYFSLSSNVNAGYLSADPTSYVNDTFEGILEAHLFDNRLILNGNFGYQKNNLYQTSSIIGDFEVKWLVLPKAGISLLGYNRNNQRYFTNTTLNTQGIGIAYENEFNSFRRKKRVTLLKEK